MRYTVGALAAALLATGKAGAGGVSLPPPNAGGDLTLRAALGQRHSVRDFRARPLSLAQAGQLLWAAQGLNRPERRTTPSAGARYPLTVYLVAGAVAELPDGVYRYHPNGHRMDRLAAGDRRARLAEAALDQPWVRTAPAAVVITADYARTTAKYGERGRRYVHMEVGHAAQNVYLQAEALGLGTVMVGAFAERAVARVLDLAADETPLAILPVGDPQPGS
jgi:SagB-type dehydrogenase family enzyme